MQKILFNPICAIRIISPIDSVDFITEINYFTENNLNISFDEDSNKFSVDKQEHFIHISFNINMNNLSTSNEATFSIYNLSPFERENILTMGIGSLIEFYSGYDELNLIFSGKIIDVESKKSGTEWVLEISCSDEKEEGKKIFKNHYPKNTKYEKILLDICESLLVPFVIDGVTTTKLIDLHEAVFLNKHLVEDLPLKRGFSYELFKRFKDFMHLEEKLTLKNQLTDLDHIQDEIVLFGLTKEILTKICSEIGYIWSFQNGILVVKSKYDFFRTSSSEKIKIPKFSDSGLVTDTNLIFSISKQKKQTDPVEKDQFLFDKKEKEISKKESLEEKQIIKDEKKEKISKIESDKRKKERKKQRDFLKKNRQEKFEKNYEKDYFEVEIPIVPGILPGAKIQLINFSYKLEDYFYSMVSLPSKLQKLEYILSIEEVEFFGDNFGGDFIARILCPIEEWSII